VAAAETKVAAAETKVAAAQAALTQFMSAYNLPYSAIQSNAHATLVSNVEFATTTYQGAVFALSSAQKGLESAHMGLSTAQSALQSADMILSTTRRHLKTVSDRFDDGERGGMSHPAPFPLTHSPITYFS
jgi:hypothetical protein